MFDANLYKSGNNTMQSGSIGSAAALQAMKSFMGKSGQQGGGSSNNFVRSIDCRFCC